MALMVREFFPLSRFFERPGATETIAGAAIELADIDTRGFDGHDVHKCNRATQLLGLAVDGQSKVPWTVTGARR